MTVAFPRISITVDDGSAGTQGDLRGLSFGFGLHQAWLYCALFGMTAIFHPSANEAGAHHIPLAFTVFVGVFTIMLIFTAITDQKLLRFYTARPVMVGAAALASIGTLALFALAPDGSGSLALATFAGTAMGVGSAALTMFWGVAYSREGTASIVVNSAVAIVLAVAVYSVILHLIPYPFAGILTALLPIGELPLLWQFTPISYTLRHVVPIFNPLPIKKASFMLRFGPPVLLFGFALGVLRTVSLQVILPSSDPTTQLLALFAGGAVAMLLLVTTFSIDRRSHWDFLFRPIVPVVAATLFFLPSLGTGGMLLPSLAILIGYICLETLMWIFLGQLAQEFRFSPICMFGTGCGALTAGAYVGSYLGTEPAILQSITPFGESGGILLIMFTLMLGNALLPRVRDIKRIAKPHDHKDGGKSKAVSTFNQETERILFGSAAAWPAWKTGLGTTPILPYEPESTANNSLSWKESEEGVVGTKSEAEEERDAAESHRKSGRFRTQCEIIANRYLLSRRETEVMFLLARGYNAALIQEKLCISKSTAKTHISHIYRKLDIHNQQELLAMVEETRESAEKHASH